MPQVPAESMPGAEFQRLLPYVTDLECEVDRLRRQGRFVDQHAREALVQVQRLCREAKTSADFEGAVSQIERTTIDFARILADVRDYPGFHPAHDQVVPIAARPLIEQVFHWQQRLERAPQAVLRLELEVDYLDWFPSRLRHIIDNLIANALKFSAADKGESRVTLGLRRTPLGYELRISDNGVGIPLEARMGVLELFHRAAPAREAGLGVGLAVVKLLVEQSGGTLTVESLDGQGTSFVVFLPRFDVNDFLEVNCRDDLSLAAPSQS